MCAARRARAHTGGYRGFVHAHLVRGLCGVCARPLLRTGLSPVLGAARVGISETVLYCAFMLELNPISLLGATTSLARLHQILASMPNPHEVLVSASVATISPSVVAFRDEADKLGARLASVVAVRLIVHLNQDPCRLTVAEASHAMNDMESRFADYIAEVKLFSLNLHEATLLAPADELVQQDHFSTNFPKTAFEVEEAAKCIVYGRSTASVFHAMRMLEVGIRALSLGLEIDDPVSGMNKNWYSILEKIKTSIESRWPSKARTCGSIGEQYMELYAHLDAVRVPWRNATMHVDRTYQPHEALHILRCATFFMKSLSEIIDENGDPIGGLAVQQ